VDLEHELSTLTTSLEDVAKRLSTIVETQDPDIPSDLYTDLVAAERSIHALLRRLRRAHERRLAR
jgi:hypothetical protein